MSPSLPVIMACSVLAAGACGDCGVEVGAVSAEVGAVSATGFETSAGGGDTVTAVCEASVGGISSAGGAVEDTVGRVVVVEVDVEDVEDVEDTAEDVAAEGVAAEDVDEGAVGWAG